MTTKEEMIENQLKKRGIADPEVLKAMWDVDRSLFVPDEMKPHAMKTVPFP